MHATFVPATEVNSTRVQSDVLERIQESRGQVESRDSQTAALRLAALRNRLWHVLEKIRRKARLRLKRRWPDSINWNTKIGAL
jgi:hypothetical protein